MQDCYISVSINGASSLNGSISFTDSTTTGYKSDPDVVYGHGDIHLVYLDNTQHKILYVKASFNNVLNQVLNIVEESKNNVTTLDLLGKKNKSKINTSVIQIYDDGKVKKRMIIE